MVSKKICFLLFAFCVMSILTGCASTTGGARGLKKRIDLPSFPSWRRHYWEDKDLWGNRGNFPHGYMVRTYPKASDKIVSPKIKIRKRPVIDEEIVIEEYPTFEERPAVEEYPVIMEKEMPQPKRKRLPETYTVKKGDCLWNIAGSSEVYGNPLMWPKIYEANRNKIKNPDLIYPDQILIIPRGEEEEEFRNERFQTESEYMSETIEIEYEK